MTSILSRFSLFIVLFLSAVMFQPSSVFAADKTSAETSSQNSENEFSSLDSALVDIGRQKDIIEDLQKRVSRNKGLAQKAFAERLDKMWLELLALNLNYATEVASREDDSPGFEKFLKRAGSILRSQPEIVDAMVRQTQARIEIPAPDLPATEQAAAYTNIFSMLDKLNLAYEYLIQSVELSEKLNLDVAKQLTSLKKELSDRATDQSIFLEMMMHEAVVLRSSVDAVPDDAEQKAKLLVTSNQIKSLAAGLSVLLEMMDRLSMNTTEYHELVLSATGEITSDVFEVGVITNLFIGWGQTLWTVVIEDGPDLIFKVLLFLIIVYISRKLANIVQRIAEEAMKRANFQLSELLRRMVLSVVRNVIIVLGLLIALSQFGISLGPLLAGLGVVGFVIGFALQDTLSNFASGLMIITYRPYDVGDLIESAGVFGEVSAMSLVNTTIMTLDNQTIVIPNNKIWGDVIKNVTAQTKRRVDMVFGIAYDDDIAKAEQVLQEIVVSHEKVLKDPEPMVRLHELGDSSVNFIVRPWVDMTDYWDVYWDVTRSVKMRFDEEGISIPFPQRDVHIYNEDS